MISLPKEKTIKYLARFFLLLTGLMVLFGSLILTGLEIMANDMKANNLRSVPIQYIKEMPNGERISKTYKVPESEVDPDCLCYLIKKTRDKLWIRLSETSKDKSAVYLLIADKRIHEAVNLIEKEKDEFLIMETFEEAIDNLKAAKTVISEENKKDIEVYKIDWQINQAGLAYEDIVKSFNYKNEKSNKIINELESFNQKNNQEEGKK